jgi:hypothetical protein
MTTTPDELVGNATAAAHIGVAPSTWRSWVQRGYAPAPIRRQIRGGHALPVWDRAEVDRWQASRRGQGWARGTTRPRPTDGVREGRERVA